MMTDPERIREALSFISPDCDRDTWVRMAMAIKSELGEAGFDIWDEWGQQGESYDARDARDTWRSIKADGKVTIGTLFHEAKARGWVNGSHSAPSPQEIAQRKRIAEERVAQDEAEIEQERAQTAAWAEAVWKAATEARPDHLYLVRKKVAPPPDRLREIDARELAEILGYQPQSSGEPLMGRVLVAPVFLPGRRFSTLESIDEAGRKAALRGRGTKTGAYWTAQESPEGDGPEPLLIGEGIVTVLSAVAATGSLGVSALSAGNLPSVAKLMRERYSTRPIVVLADLVKKTGEPDPHAVEAARSVGGLLAVPHFARDRPEGEKDFNDMAQRFGLEAVGRAIANAKVPAEAEVQPTGESPPAGDSVRAAGQPSDREEIERLAALSALEYDRVRKDRAEAMRVRPSTLDKMVASARKRDEDDTGMVDVDLWPDPIGPAELLSEISATVRRFIICQPETADAVTLWIAMTWFMDVVQVAPLAIITAPEKRCGKSMLLSLLKRLSHRPLTASNISSAAMFRAVDAWKPTLLIDEADAFVRESEELRGLINSGHTRDSAYVVRTVGDDHEPRKFNTWGAKALAGIGHLADTLMDRAIVLELRRKLPNEKIDRLRYAEPDLFETLAEKLARLAEDYRDVVRQARPTLPESLNDRAQDNWEPLLAIADVAGSEWPARARKSALKLSGAESPTMSTGAELLADIQGVFEAKRIDRISTADLIKALCDDEEMPWATYNRGKPISPRQVAKRLGEYGIRSKNVRIGGAQAKGFELEQFEDAFSRYLSAPSGNPSHPSQTLEANKDGGFGGTESRVATVTENPSVPRKAPPVLGWDGGTDKKGGTSERPSDARYV